MATPGQPPVTLETPTSASLAGAGHAHHQSLGGPHLPTRRRRRPRHSLRSYLFLAPFLVAFVLFTVIPVGLGVFVSLHRWSGVQGDLGFVGIANYRQLVTGSGFYGQEFYSSMANTVLFVVISVPLLWFLPTMLGYMVFNAPAKWFFRPVFFYPSVFSAAAVGTIFDYLLQTNGGSLNNLLGVNVPWLTAQPEAWISIDIATIWLTLGISFIIMYTGITQVPRTTIEASMLDGAGAWSRFTKVILPQLRNVSLVVIVIDTIASFNLFVQDLVMTGGGPGTSTTTISMTIWQEAFTSFNVGDATAMAFLFALVLAAVAAVQYVYGVRRQR